MSKITRFARSPHGRKMTKQAMDYAKSPQGKRKIAQVRKQLASRGRARPR